MPQAHKLTSSQVNRRTAAVLAGWVVMVSSIGCDESASFSSAGPPSSALAVEAPSPINENSIDAGVIFADQTSYLCVPLGRVGLPTDAKVTSLRSSCECVEPSIVEYHVPGGGTERGVLLRFVAEQSDLTGGPTGSTKASNVIDLAILVDFLLADGTTHQMTVRAGHSLLAEESL